MSFSLATITFFSSQLVRLLELEDRQRHLVDGAALADLVERGGGALPSRLSRVSVVGDLLQQIDGGLADFLDDDIQGRRRPALGSASIVSTCDSSTGSPRNPASRAIASR